MAKKLYVGNLSYDTTSEALTPLFEAIGPVSSVALIMDRETGRSKGFAFVEMADEASAQKAIAELNGKELDGRKLTVAEARPPRDDRSPRAGDRPWRGDRGDRGGPSRPRF
jgi:cold-inducible RNA-binding protein